VFARRVRGCWAAFYLAVSGAPYAWLQGMAASLDEAIAPARGRGGAATGDLCIDRSATEPGSFSAAMGPRQQFFVAVGEVEQDRNSQDQAMSYEAEKFDALSFCVGRKEAMESPQIIACPVAGGSRRA